MIPQVLFVVLAVVAVASAVLAVVGKQLVHAALWLVVTLGAVAGCFLLMGAELLAWVQVLVYVGAVVVLIVFALMLTRQPTGAVSAEVTKNQPFAAAIGVAGAAGMGATFVVAFGDHHLDGDVSGTTAVIGRALFSWWVLPFEVLSVLLLAALIGAIVLSRDEQR